MLKYNLSFRTLFYLGSLVFQLNNNIVFVTYHYCFKNKVSILVSTTLFGKKVLKVQDQMSTTLYETNTTLWKLYTLKIYNASLF